MSRISMDAPTVHANASDLQHLVKFVFAHERLLKEFGAIKIKLQAECRQALKKRRTEYPPCSDVQQVIRVNNDELIYSVQTVACMVGSACDQSLPINENTFWSSLSCSDGRRRSNVSVFPNQSFFSKRSRRIYFDLHRIPSQSLLKLCSSEVTRQFVPSLKRAHGPGAIFPLASAQQRLFLLDYHHEGGARQWCIIPARERETLQQVIKRQNASRCIEHEELLIEPSVLDKYKIRYHRLVQHPNEFVVLAAGALAQSFAESASWNETVNFALPTWLHDGHASARAPPCLCNFNIASVPKIIDISLFKPELVQRYIATHLSLVIDDESSPLTGDNRVKIAVPITPCDSTSSSLNVLDGLTCHTSSVESFSRNNQELRITTESAMTVSNRLLPHLIISPISDYCLDDADDERTPEGQLIIEEKGNFGVSTNQEKRLTTSTQLNLRENQLQLMSEPSNHYQIFQYPGIHQRLTTDSSVDDHLLSFEELMDFLPFTPVTVQSTQSQPNEQVNIHESNSRQELASTL